MKEQVKMILPYWVGRQSAPESRSESMELLRVYANWVDEPEPHIKYDTSVSDDTFIKEICDLVNTKYIPKSESLVNPKRKGVGIWVGFPETPVGRLNSSLASQLWHMEEEGE